MHFIRSAEYCHADCRYDFQLLLRTPDAEPINMIYSHRFGDEESTAMYFGQESLETKCILTEDSYPNTMLEMDPIDFQTLITAGSREEMIRVLKDSFRINSSAEDAAAEAFLSRCMQYLRKRLPQDALRIDAHMLYAFTDLLLDPDDILQNIFSQETWHAIYPVKESAETEQQLFDSFRLLEGLRMYDDDSIHELAVFCTQCNYTPGERVEVHFITSDDKLKMRILWR